MTHSEATEAYAAYLNGLPRAQAEYDEDQLADYEQDMAKAKRAMEVAWLEETAR